MKKVLSPHDLSVLRALACAEVFKRGGSVEIVLNDANRTLLRQDIILKQINRDVVELTLSPADERVRSYSGSKNRALWRFELAIKYLVATTTNNKLTFTTTDLSLGEPDLGFRSKGTSLYVEVDPEVQPKVEGDMEYLFGSKRIIAISPVIPKGRKH
jgi:hypothetical protein